MITIRVSAAWAESIDWTEIKSASYESNMWGSLNICRIAGTPIESCDAHDTSWNK